MAGGTVKCFLCKATVSGMMNVVSVLHWLLCRVQQFLHKSIRNATNKLSPRHMKGTLVTNY